MAERKGVVLIPSLRSIIQIQYYDRFCGDDRSVRVLIPSLRSIIQIWRLAFRLNGIKKACFNPFTQVNHSNQCAWHWWRAALRSVLIPSLRSIIQIRGMRRRNEVQKSSSFNPFTQVNHSNLWIRKGKRLHSVTCVLIPSLRSIIQIRLKRVLTDRLRYYPF